MGDYLEEMMQVEAKVKEYRRIGDKKIFANYFELSDLLDTPKFCSYVDSFQVGQSGYCNTSYKGPLDQGLTAGMAYFLSYHYLYVAKILAADLMNNTVQTAISTDAGLTFPGTNLITYLQSPLELQLIEYRKDAVKFYDLIKVIIAVKASVFVTIFLGLYLLILLGLLKRLSSEIWLTNGMLNMIPMFILESNSNVQNQIWLRKRIS